MYQKKNEEMEVTGVDTLQIAWKLRSIGNDLEAVSILSMAAQYVDRNYLN